MGHVVVLGAGASSEAGAPLMANFRSEAVRVARGINESWSGKAQDTFRYVMDKWDERLNVEEFYVTMDVRERVARGAVTDGEADAVRYVIAKVLHETTGGLDAATNGAAHVGFAHWLGSEAASDVTVLTLNWDTVLEWAASHQRIPFNLGFDRLSAMDGSEPRRGAARPGRPILKLHGSINWWFCPRGHHLRVEENAEAQTSHWEQFMPPRCTEVECVGPEGQPRLVPAMVPPTGQKFEGRGPYHRLFARVWGSARDALKNASQLTIVGYSFPRTDAQFRFFLADALAEAPLKQVDVVSKNKWDEESERKYLDGIVDENLRRTARFHYGGFRKWVETLRP